MSKTSPQPNVGSELEKSKIRSVISERRLTGCANDLKWGKLLDAIRLRKDWQPSYRYKSVDGRPSEWDVEWWHRLPFPMMSVEWFDIALTQEVRTGALTEPEIIDHSDWIIAILKDANFSYDVFGDIIRVFGYLPKSLDELDVSTARQHGEQR